MKKEFIFGLIGSFIVIGLTVFYINQYKSNMQRVLNPVQPVVSSSSTGQQPTSNSVALTKEEVAKHNSSADCWIIISNAVYQITDYLALHPGGAQRIIQYCGTDATQAYATQDGKGSHSATANQELASLKLGDLNQQVNIQNSSSAVKNNTNQINSSGGLRRREIEDD